MVTMVRKMMKFLSKSATVTVVEKRMVYKEKIYHYITFEFDNGKRKEFAVSGDTYRVFEVNEKGKLKYRGNTFIGFKFE